jgi:hypothetical protein
MTETATATPSAASEVRVPRSFTAKYKLEILEEIDAAVEPGDVGRILRREGLYSSLISAWRRQRNAGALEAMNQKKRGPKVDTLAAENRRLKEKLARLEERLDTAEELADAQGKAFALLQAMSRKSGDTK